VLARGTLVALLATSCASRSHDPVEPSDAGPSDAGPSDAGPGEVDAPATSLALPPVNAGIDYQLGGAYPPPPGVQIVVRDRTATKADGVYNVCYVNGFQIQPDDEAFWLDQHPELVLRDAAGEPVIDADWNEILIDVATPARRAAVAEIVGGWIARCKASGFDAVEIDNLDAFTRSGGLLRAADAVAAMQLFATTAHAHGLPIAQKNAAEMVDRRAEMGTDFVVAEECNRYQECDAYTAGYGDHVLVIEYRRVDFDAGCRAFPGLSIVLRDRSLVRRNQGGYVYAGC